MNKEWFTTKEAAEYIGHSESTLENWRVETEKSPGPRFYKPLGKVLYNRDDLDSWVKGNKE